MSPIENKLEGIEKNVLLSSYTTLGIGGPAKYFFVAKDKNSIIKAIQAAKECGLDFFILGGGSNLLVSDRGFDGLVIKIENKRIKQNGIEIWAEAGVILNQVIELSKKSELAGLEWAAGIPGTVGGAIRGNSGAFGKSISTVIQELEVLEINSEISVSRYLKDQCFFGYRESVFKRNKNLIILRVKFVLEKGSREEIGKRIERNLNYRKEKQPIGFRSAGSVFKNPEGFSAGKLIEMCNLKGTKKGGAEISKKHGNFIVNLGNATSDDVVYLINLAKDKVKQKFNIVLEEEIEYLGF